MWTAGACHYDTGTCNTFTVLAKNDGNENDFGFYKLETLQKFLGSKSLELNTCWTNTNLEKSYPLNNYLRNDQKNQKLNRFLEHDSQTNLFPGCNQINDFAHTFVKNFEQNGLAHFLHSHIPPYVEKKRQQLLEYINTEIKKAQDFGAMANLPLLVKIQKAILDLDNIVDSDLTTKPVSRCNYT